MFVILMCSNCGDIKRFLNIIYIYKQQTFIK